MNNFDKLSAEYKRLKREYDIIATRVYAGVDPPDVGLDRLRDTQNKIDLVIQRQISTGRKLTDYLRTRK